MPEPKLLKVDDGTKEFDGYNADVSQDGLDDQHERNKFGNGFEDDLFDYSEFDRIKNHFEKKRGRRDNGHVNDIVISVVKGFY